MGRAEPGVFTRRRHQAPGAGGEGGWQCHLHARLLCNNRRACGVRNLTTDDAGSEGAVVNVAFDTKENAPSKPHCHPQNLSSQPQAEPPTPRQSPHHLNKQLNSQSKTKADSQPSIPSSRVLLGGQRFGGALGEAAQGVCPLHSGAISLSFSLPVSLQPETGASNTERQTVKADLPTAEDVFGFFFFFLFFLK